MSSLSKGRRARTAASLICAMMFGAVFCAAAPGVRAQSGQSWASYKNERFGFALSYPSNLFTPQPPPEKRDGQTFVTNDGRAKIVVYATINDERFSPEDYKKTILKEFGGYDQMDYSPKGQSWFVLSGFRGENIYYQKVMFSCAGRVINALSITFPRAEKRFYEGLVEVMEDSFKPGSGEGCR